MSDPFSILEVTSSMRSDVEQLGSKPKFWFRYQAENWLFKEARVNTGEDWAEKVASEIAHLLGLPTHHTELAVWEGKRGCAVRSFVAPGQFLVHGNELLGGLITDYDKEKTRGHAEHTFENIVTVLERLFPSDKARREAAFRMVGYLVFDALVDNTDRHHQNWGVVLEQRAQAGGKHALVLEIAPTFDHASSLGRELTDEARERYLREDNAVGRYISRGKGGIFRDAQAKHGLSPMMLARILAQRYPKFFKPWQKRVRQLSDEALRDLLDRIPDQRISIPGRAFALRLLSMNRKLLQETL